VGTVRSSSPRTAVYTPKGVLPHAALLPQAKFAHWGKFLAAASRRSRGRVSVPVWLAILSDQRPITASVGRYPTAKLIGRSPLHRRAPKRSFPTDPTRPAGSCGITARFRALPPTRGQVDHALRTRPPREAPESAPVRLACIRHAASVDPEPGSNSPPVPAHAQPHQHTPLPGRPARPGTGLCGTPSPAAPSKGHAPIP
jgi:hypothetical protein